MNGLAPLLADYWSNEVHECVALYSGDVVLRDRIWSAHAPGVIQFDWLPSPHTSWRAWSDLDTIVEHQLANIGATELSAEPPPLDGVPDAAVAHDQAAAEAMPWRGAGRQDNIRVGRRFRADEVRFNLVNFAPVRGNLWLADGEGSGWLGGLRLDLGEYQLRIDSRRDLDEAVRSLVSSGGFAFTHVASLSRIDGARITRSAWDACSTFLFHWLSFARGALVGVALPVGHVADTRPYAEWSCTVVDPWIGRLSWLDQTRADDLVELLSCAAAVREDDFWTMVLRRAIRYYTAANQPPIDQGIVMAFAGLDLLAWAVIERDLDLLHKDDRLTTATRLRLLLNEIGLPRTVPAALEALVEFTKRPGDGPGALANVRNRLAHPRGEFPPSGVIVDAWRLALWYLELATLWRIGYKGSYGSRVCALPRWAGDVAPVPWAVRDAECARPR